MSQQQSHQGTDSETTSKHLVTVERKKLPINRKKSTGEPGSAAANWG